MEERALRAARQRDAALDKLTEANRKYYEAASELGEEKCWNLLHPPPQEVIDDPDFRPTGKTRSKQMVSIEMRLVVNELAADIYYNPKTNEYRCAKFPEGYVNEVNYDASIRAFLYLLNNDCNVSIDKSRKFLSDLTGGKLNISKGMVNSLLKEFADKSEDSLKELRKDLFLAPVLHTDNTNARVNVKTCFVFVCAAPDGRAIFDFREHKGHKVS